VNLTFGPVPSRRFGLSLGLDLSPDKKRCNYDCLYCELAAAKPVDTIDDPLPADRFIDALKEALKDHPETEVITLTANGEPTLYPYLHELIQKINTLKGERKSLILSNGSTLHDPAVRSALAQLDMVKFSFDCGTPRCLKRLDRPLRTLEPATLARHIQTFRQIFQGQLVLEILLVAGINDKPEEIAALNTLLKNLGADRIDLGTVDRPPAYPVTPLDYHALHQIAAMFDADLPVHIVSRRTIQSQPARFDEAQILDTLAKRPLTMEDMQTLFDQQSLQTFHQLLSADRIAKKEVMGLTFYGTAFSRQKSKKTGQNP